MKSYSIMSEESTGASLSILLLPVERKPNLNLCVICQRLKTSVETVR